jgi:hypothetical protein
MKSGSEKLYVTAFTFRPVLQSKRKTGDQRTRAFACADAHSKYSAGLRENDLSKFVGKSKK